MFSILKNIQCCVHIKLSIIEINHYIYLTIPAASSDISGQGEVMVTSVAGL